MMYPQVLSWSGWALAMKSRMLLHEGVTDQDLDKDYVLSSVQQG